MALRTHHARSSIGGNDPDDLEAPRDNVLVYYGTGGYGKTALSEELQEGLREKQNWHGGAARLDLTQGWDFVTMLLGVRASLAGKLGVLPAFDIALRAGV